MITFVFVSIVEMRHECRESHLNHLNQPRIPKYRLTVINMAKCIVGCLEEYIKTEEISKCKWQCIDPLKILP